VRIQELVNLLQKIRKDYYEGRATTTDEQFTQLEQELRRLDPGNSYFKQVGSPVLGGNKIYHSPRMLSLNNTRNVKDMARWARKYFPGEQVDIISQPKVDGVSISIKYRNGSVESIATRGDGVYGRDVTYIKDYIRDISKTIPIDSPVDIRGEAYLEKETQFRKGKSLRNMAAGLLARKEGKEELAHLRFIAYDIIGLPDVRSEEDKMKVLTTLMPNVISYEKIQSLGDIQNIYQQYTTQKRKDLPYEIDGVVYRVNRIEDQNRFERETRHHPNFMMAYKFAAEGKQTRLIRVDWRQGRTGKITPIAIFQPIIIGGVTIQKASLGSRRKFELLRLEPGDIIFVSRKNEVIPFVEANISKNIVNT